MNAIVAVDSQWGICKNNGLLFHLPQDMQYFKQKTLGKIVAMGSNTLLSFPNSKPLKNRVNIVLFPGGEQREDCQIVQSLEEMKKVLQQYPSEDVFVIGGAMFYATMLDFCDTVYVTKVSACGDAQVFFPNLDEKEGWSKEEESLPICDGEYTLTFCVYKNSQPKSL